MEESSRQWLKERRRTVKYLNQEPFAEENKGPAGLHRQALGNPIDTCPWVDVGGGQEGGDHGLTACTAMAFASGASESPIFLHRGPCVAVLPPGS